MTVRIGINPLTWTNDDLPTLGADIPLEVCLREGRLAGYAGFELGSKFPRQPEVLGPILERHDLQLVSGWYSSHLLEQSVEDDISDLENHLSLLKNLGAEVMVFCEVSGSIHGDQKKPLSHRPHLSVDQWSEFGEKLTRVANHCLGHGVKIAYHHHIGTVVETEKEIDSLMAHTGECVGLLLDTGHLTYAGGDPHTVQLRHASRIVHVHCKDIRKAVLQDAKNRDLSFLDAVINGVFTVPGDADGSVNFLDLFISLRREKYSSWLVVEADQDPAIADPLTYATLGANYLKKMCKEAGIRLEE